jgi:mRNA interferase MazF
MITSNLSRAGHPSRVLVERGTPHGQRTGLLSDSVLMTDNLATVRDAEVDRTIGTWADMGPVDAALRHTLGI